MKLNSDRAVHKQHWASSPFFGHHNSQELVFQPLRCDHEVEQRHLGGEFRQVVGVAQLGGDVEAEVLGVLDQNIPKPQHFNTAWGSENRHSANNQTIHLIRMRKSEFTSDGTCYTISEEDYFVLKLNKSGKMKIN